MNINYGIIAVPPGSENAPEFDILHFVGYDEKPTDDDFISVKEELLFDDDIKIDVEFVLILAPDDVVSYFRELYATFATSGE